MVVTGMLTGTVEHRDAHLDRVLAGFGRNLIEERLDTPADPAGTDRAQPAGMERAFGEFIADRAQPGAPAACTSDRRR